MRNVLFPSSLALLTLLASPAVIARPDGSAAAASGGGQSDRFFLFAAGQTPLGPLVESAFEGAQAFAPTVSADHGRKRLGEAFPRLFAGGSADVVAFEAELKAGVDAHYEDRKAEAEKLLADAIALAMRDPELLAGAPATLATKLADGAVVRYRNALATKGQDKVKALAELDRFVRHFPTLGITVDDHPPQIAEEWKKLRAKALSDSGSLSIGIHPVEYERAGQGCELLVNGASAGRISGSPVALPRGRYLVKVRCEAGASWVQAATVAGAPTSLTVPVRAMLAARGNPETGGIVLVAANEDDAAALVSAVSQAAGFSGAVVVRTEKDRLQLGQQVPGAVAPTAEAVARFKGSSVTDWKAVSVASGAGEVASADTGSRFGPWPWVVGGAGVAGLATGVVLNLMYQSEFDAGKVENLDSLESLSWTGYIGGGLLLGAGVALFLLDDATPAPAGTSTAVSVGGRGLMVRF